MSAWRRSSGVGQVSHGAAVAPRSKRPPPRDGRWRVLPHGGHLREEVEARWPAGFGATTRARSRRPSIGRREIRLARSSPRRAARSRYEAGMTTASRHPAPTDVTGDAPRPSRRRSGRSRRCCSAKPSGTANAASSASARSTSPSPARRVSRRGGGMLAAAGIRRGDRVALMTNRSEFIEIWLGCGWLGAVAVPINVSSRRLQLAHILGNSGARLLAVEAGLLPVLDALPPGASRPGDRLDRRRGGSRRRQARRRPQAAARGSRRPGRDGPRRRHRHPLHVRHHGTFEGRALPSRAVLGWRRPRTREGSYPSRSRRTPIALGVGRKERLRSGWLGRCESA